MDETGQKAQELRRYLMPMVAMFVEQIKPREDEISKAEAYRLYKRNWVDLNIKRGNLTLRNKGKRQILSRSQIETLIAVESTPTRCIFNNTKTNYQSL